MLIGLDHALVKVVLGFGFEFLFEILEDREITRGMKEYWITKAIFEAAAKLEIGGLRLIDFSPREKKVEGLPAHYDVIPVKVIVELRAGDRTVEATGPALVVMPPGDSSMTVRSDGAVVRLFTSRSADLCDTSRNSEFYESPDPNVGSFEAWPDPVDGPAIRVYDLESVPSHPDRFGRIFRCSTLMVNWLRFKLPAKSTHSHAQA